MNRNKKMKEVGRKRNFGGKKYSVKCRKMEMRDCAKKFEANALAKPPHRAGKKKRGGKGPNR